MSTIQHLRYDAPDYPVRATALFHLMGLVWPSAPDSDEASESAAAIEEWKASKSHHFVIFEDNVALANATLFVRAIITARSPLSVGALAAVCVHPDHRGHGWGRDVVRAAFEFLPEMGVHVSLFQTGVPDFYARLGARLVSNRFHNGPESQQPFWDDHIMIFPSTFNWPAGEIDLNGPGY